MDTSPLIRDAGKVKANLVLMDDLSVVTKRGCKLQIPMRYTEKSLASISSEIYVAGIWAIIVDDKYYGVSITNAMMHILPASTQVIKVDGDDYLEFGFTPGSVVFKTTELLKTDTLVYQIFNEFISSGNIPWYLSYEDVARLFDTAPRYAGLQLNSNHAILEMFAACIARSKENRMKYYRQTVTNREQLLTDPPVFIPYRDVIYSATDTTAKLLGSHSGDGLTSALNNPAQRTQRIEELLRR